MTMTKTIATTATVLGLAFAPIAAVPALAQEADATGDAQTSTESQATGEAQAQADYSDEQLENFATAAVQVAQVQQSYQPQLEAAETPEDQQALIEEANAEIVAAVEGVEGISVEEYVEIGQAASGDEDLNQRITMLIEEQMAQ